MALGQYVGSGVFGVGAGVGLPLGAALGDDVGGDLCGKTIRMPRGDAVGVEPIG